MKAISLALESLLGQRVNVHCTDHCGGSYLYLSNSTLYKEGNFYTVGDYALAELDGGGVLKIVINCDSINIYTY